MLLHLVGHVCVDIILTTIISQGSQSSIIAIFLTMNLFILFYVKIPSHFPGSCGDLVGFYFLHCYPVTDMILSAVCGRPDNISG